MSVVLIVSLDDGDGRPWVHGIASPSIEHAAAAAELILGTVARSAGTWVGAWSAEAREYPEEVLPARAEEIYRL